MSKINVTDHAVLRYLERVMGFDIDGVRKHIADTCAPAMRSGAGCLSAEGVKFQFANSSVTTITPATNMPNVTRIGRLTRHPRA